MALKDETCPDMQSRCQTKKLSPKNGIFDREIPQWEIMEICKKNIALNVYALEVIGKAKVSLKDNRKIRKNV